MLYHYKPKGVCSREMQIDIEDGIVRDVKIIGGCDGNTQGVCALVKGLSAKDVMDKLNAERPAPTNSQKQLQSIWKPRNK